MSETFVQLELFPSKYVSVLLRPPEKLTILGDLPVLSLKDNKINPLLFSVEDIIWS